MEKKLEEKKQESTKVKAEKFFEVVKALTAMKLTRDDAEGGQVFEDLIIGSVGTAYNLKQLQATGVTHILTCAAKIKPRFESSFKYKVLPLLDSPNQNILEHVEEANQFIREARSENYPGQPPKNKVLVHCFAGKSRATTFTLCYMIKEMKISLKEGLERIWKVRPIAAPNPGFMI